MKPVLIIRPEPDASRTARRVAEAGMHPLISPVTRIEPVEVGALPLASIDAIIVSSPHALQDAVLAQIPKHIPIHCVGSRAQARVREAGLTLGHVAPTIEALSQQLTQGHILYLSGEDIHDDSLALLSRPGITLIRIVTYRAVALSSLDADTIAALRREPVPVALLTSVRSAQLFAGLLPEKLGMDRLTCVCLSASIAEAARALGAVRVHVAVEPTEDALIAALMASC